MQRGEHRHNTGKGREISGIGAVIAPDGATSSEFALTAALVLALYVRMTNGGPEWFGRWFADLMKDAGT